MWFELFAGIVFIFWQEHPWLIIALFSIQLWFAMPSPWHGIIGLIGLWVGYLVLLPLALALLKR
jgi:hypothetical protein